MASLGAPSLHDEKPFPLAIEAPDSRVTPPTTEMLAKTATGSRDRDEVN